MKEMTCRQLGGPCDVVHRGNDANEIIQAQDQHLREVVAFGDTAHREALDAIVGYWKRPVSGLRWYRQAHRTFATLPELSEPDSGPSGFGVADAQGPG